MADLPAHIVRIPVVASFFEREIRDRGNQKMKTDPRMQPTGDVPFDMQRMIMGGFTPILEEAKA